MPGDHDNLTWATLLAHWTTLARASLALPRDAAGDRWRAAVAPIIALQALTHALGELDRLADDERAVALDRAALLIERHAADLVALWDDRPLHKELSLLIADARRALAGAQRSGLEWPVALETLTGPHPADLVALILATGFDGDLYVPAPGVTLFRGCPAAFASSPGRLPGDDIAPLIEDALPGLGPPRPVASLRMPYRQFDFAKARAVRDVVIEEPAEPEARAGQPLLVAAILEGRPQPVALPPRRTEHQARLPLVWARAGSP